MIFGRRAGLHPVNGAGASKFRLARARPYSAATLVPAIDFHVTAPRSG
jgi:hypothetical protein